MFILLYVDAGWAICGFGHGPAEWTGSRKAWVILPAPQLTSRCLLILLYKILALCALELGNSKDNSTIKVNVEDYFSASPLTSPFSRFLYTPYPFRSFFGIFVFSFNSGFSARTWPQELLTVKDCFFWPRASARVDHDTSSQGLISFSPSLRQILPLMCYSINSDTSGVIIINQRHLYIQ